MMEIAQYREYLKSFNGRDYDRVLTYWGKVHCLMDGVVLFDSPASLKTFYAFLHSYTEETIHVDRYLSDKDSLFLEARVRIAGQRSMSAQLIAESGFADSGGMIGETAISRQQRVPRCLHEKPSSSFVQGPGVPK
jgi:hypothetical protein